MFTLEGRLTNKTEIAVFLRSAAKAMDSAIERKSSAAIFREKQTAKRKQRAFKIREQEIELENTQAVLFTLAKAHETGDIVRFPHLEDIRNRKQVELIQSFSDLNSQEEKLVELKSNKKLFDQLAIYSLHEWELAQKQLEQLMDNFFEDGINVKGENMDKLEQQALREIEKMKAELRRGELGTLGNYNFSKPSGIVIEDKKSKFIKHIPEIKLHFDTSEIENPGIITRSGDAEKFLRNLYDPNVIEVQEQFFVIYINRSSRIIGYSGFFKGGITGVLVDTRLIFATALNCLASGLILAHNHPSGNLRPSDADIQLTKRVKTIGEHHDITLADHLILTKNGYYSFADDGLI